MTPAVDARTGVKRDSECGWRGCAKRGRASCSAACWHGPEAVVTSKLPGAGDAIPKKGEGADLQPSEIQIADLYNVRS